MKKKNNKKIIYLFLQISEFVCVFKFFLKDLLCLLDFMGMDKNMGFVMFVASSKCGNTLPAFPKEYGFPYNLTPKILKEIIDAMSNRGQQKVDIANGSG